MVVAVLLADLEEPPPRHLTAQAIELFQHAEHHPRPAFAGPPFLLEIDMRAIGSFKTQFAGPPVNKLDQIPATPAA